MAQRPSVLHTAVLGLLGEQPLHGYELRARLDVLVGALRRRISFGSVYPALRSLEGSGLIAACDTPVGCGDPDQAPAAARALAPRRRRVVYGLTPDGEAHLTDLLSASGPATWDDGDFDVRFAFFARTDAATRLAVLDGRRATVRERLDRARQHAPCCGGRGDDYRAELARRSAQSLQDELVWLDEVVSRERSPSVTLDGAPPADRPGGATAPPRHAGPGTTPPTDFSLTPRTSRSTS